MLLLQAPLLIGCDVSNIAKDTMEILANKEVIQVNQGEWIAMQIGENLLPISDSRRDI